MLQCRGVGRGLLFPPPFGSCQLPAVSQPPLYRSIFPPDGTKAQLRRAEGWVNLTEHRWVNSCERYSRWVSATTGTVVHSLVSIEMAMCQSPALTGRNCFLNQPLLAVAHRTGLTCITYRDNYTAQVCQVVATLLLEAANVLS